MQRGALGSILSFHGLILLFGLLMVALVAGINVTTSGPTLVSNGTTASYTYTVVNNDSINYTNYTLLSRVNMSHFAFAGANGTFTNQTNTPVAGLYEVAWSFNLTDGSRLVVHANYTARSITSTVVNATAQDNASIELWNEAYAVTILGQVNVSVTKQNLTPMNVTVGSNITFRINLTNIGSAPVNLSLLDIYNTTYLNYTGANATENGTNLDGSEAEVYWNLTLAVGESFLVELNFTAIGSGITNNTAEVINGSDETLDSHTVTMTLTASPAPDSADPVVSLSIPANSTNTSNTSVLFNCSVADNWSPNNVTLTVWNVSGGVNYTNTTTLAGNGSVAWTVTLGEGNYTWDCLAFDTSGNSAWNGSNWTVRIDTTAPTTADDAPSGWQATNVTVTLTPSDGAGTGVAYTTYAVDGGNATNGTEVNITSDGNHSITYYSVDRAGNNESPTTVYVARDAIGPTATILSPSNGTTTNDTTPAINFTMTDALSSTINYTIYVNGVATGPNGSAANGSNTSETIAALSNGVHTIVVEGADHAGNRQNSSSLTLSVDTQDPNVTITAPENNSFTSDTTPTITINATDNVDTTLTYIIYVNGSSNANGSASNNTLTNITLSPLSDGYHVILAKVTDDVGRSFNTSINITVDATAPTLNVTTPANGSRISDTWVLVNWTVNDTNFNTTKLNFDNDWNITESTTIPVSLNITNLTAGRHTYTITANDSAGNSITTTRTLIVNSTLNVTDLSNDLDARNGLDDVQVFDGNNATRNLTGNQSLGNLSSQRLTIRARVIDHIRSQNTTFQLRNFTGEQANYRSLFTAKSSDAGTNTTIIALGSSPVAMISMENVSLFLDDDAYTGVVSFNTTGLSYTYVYWCQESNDCTRVSQCAENNGSNFDGSSACYTNSSANATIYVPHFSSVVLSLDDIVGNITITAPENATPLADGSQVYLNFTTNESVTANVTLYHNGNLTHPMQNATIWGTLATSFSGIVQGNLSANVLPNGNYTASINLTDANNNTEIVNHTFIVNDTAGPNLTSPTESGITASGATIGVSTDEYANVTVFYGTSASALTSNSSQNALSLTPSVTLSGLTASTTYYYNITGVDALGQSTTIGTYDFTTSAATNNDDDDGGGGGGGSSSSTESAYTELGATPTRITLSKGGQYTFELSGHIKTYKLRIQELSEEGIATVYFPDTGVVLELAEGESGDADVTGDGRPDVNVVLVSASQYSAFLTLSTAVVTTPAATQQNEEEGPAAEVPRILEAAEPAAETAQVPKQSPPPAVEEVAEDRGGIVVMLLIPLIILLLVLGYVAVKTKRIQFD